jgi:hypothetical protein
MAKTTIEKARPILQTANLPRKPEGLVSESAPVTPGPKTGGANLVLSTGQWLERFGTKEELSMFKEIVSKRLAQVAVTGWRTLPGGLKIPGSMVLAICTNCKAASWTAPEHADGTPCLVCNNNQAKAGGTMKSANKAEVKAWYAKEEAAQAKLVADGPRRQAALNAFNQRAREEMGPGRNPFAKD